MSTRVEKAGTVKAFIESDRHSTGPLRATIGGDTATEAESTALDDQPRTLTSREVLEAAAERRTSTEQASDDAFRQPRN